MSDKKGILLETGTNEFEIVEFSIGPVSYGINVAKVREVINPVPVTKMPNIHPWVDGIFTLRGRVMPLVNLPRCLGNQSTTTSPKVIVSELNNYYVAFLVDEVSRIHRISWTAMEPPPHIANSDMVVGIIKMAEKMVVLLDFEKIVADINPEMNEKFSQIDSTSSTILDNRKNKTILVAEDSKMLRDLLLSTLHTAGYAKIISTENGQEAWNKIEQLVKSGEPIENNIQLVITDIEMPQMDGHHLTKRIKENEKCKHLPVVIFSSLINEEMRLKGESIGANGQVSKPEINQLIELVDRFIL
ncbi:MULTISPECIES: chemotaxis protein [Sporomusa]|jgi:two-component system chemotaxis response regulator CheV|uniref:Chemotaxis protein CheV n=1 Tax=Sporomusa sphaeroides DSM 2875 TaxID=1337886 RepID=A0ABM9W3H1_9FIRM|nr:MULTISPECIES: chemotaxis protein [Sporomusa]MCM0759401.1 chemotaxis protein [Sporomusa sphaeroides DSM 2875]OLS56488.1 chemotaxis protein CheV [Sporomusa sphaeroides DSM 2875]CVK18583.1 Chemotaxis protein CheV [Sporomusa sphaeroides DSM 2875]HML35556.1 chemotaxis protein [Sporomusa sphaeroides]